MVAYDLWNEERAEPTSLWFFTLRLGSGKLSDLPNIAEQVSGENRVHTESDPKVSQLSDKANQAPVNHGLPTHPILWTDNVHFQDSTSVVYE